MLHRGFLKSSSVSGSKAFWERCPSLQNDTFNKPQNLQSTTSALSQIPNKLLAFSFLSRTNPTGRNNNFIVLKNPLKPQIIQTPPPIASSPRAPMSIPPTTRNSPDINPIDPRSKSSRKRRMRIIAEIEVVSCRFTLWIGYY